MAWNLEEAIAYYQTQGAPREQSALVNLLREIQTESGGSIPGYILPRLADAYKVKESYLQAVIARMPSLRLAQTHCLELCAGPNCGKHTALATCAEALCAKAGKCITLKYVPCMRMCGKGPNIKYDGVLYHGASEKLLKELIEKSK